MVYPAPVFPFKQAKSFRSIAPGRKVRLIVIHDMEAPESNKTAENVSEWFATTAATSAHICVDADSIVQCVHDKDVAYAAPFVNHDGFHVELAGYGKQTREEWLDDFSKKMLERAANAIADYCLHFDIPPVQLTNDQLKAGQKGIIGHYQASDVYKPNNNHRDPGVNFPWDYFILRIATLTQQKCGAK